MALNVNRVNKDILDRSSQAAQRILGVQRKTAVSPDEQLRQYQAHAKDTSWATDLANQTPNEHARYFLHIIGSQGLDGLAKYVGAMKKLQSQGGGGIAQQVGVGPGAPRGGTGGL